MTNMREWINDQSQASYSEWERRTCVKPPVTDLPQKQEPREVEDKSIGSKEDELNEAWLRHVIFSPSCGALRQVACSVVESICQVSITHKQQNWSLFQHCIVHSVDNFVEKKLAI